MLKSKTQINKKFIKSAAYAVDNNLAPILSVSFGACESNLGQTELTFYEDLWAQAAAQGITVCVASGDAGAAGCDAPSAVSGSGLGVNGLASTPSNTCVGGTMFKEAGAIHGSPPDNANGQSVLGYLPELPWNESGTQPLGSDLWAGGGGASEVHPKPYWQAGPCPRQGS
jgi:subtilase family serine protease